MHRLVWLYATALVTAATAATLPSGFTEATLTSSLSAGTAMALAPDGRIFVAQQGGALRVIKNGALLSQPFLTVTVDSSGERGLLGVAFDPNFATNNFVYIYYTATTPTVHNRVSRFMANGDVAASGSEVILLELDNLNATNHNGGGMHFGPDGKLYIGVGENANGNNAQTLSNLLGKMLRINGDGTIPADNPFIAQTTGKNGAIWAMGLRNPYTFNFQNGSGRLFINDVGENTWEEINDGRAGANYGWPSTEGFTTDPRFVSPLFEYGHGSGPTVGCAITGGTFYNPQTVRFPSSYVGKYFFADLCSGWIRVYDPAANVASDFASGGGSIVDLEVSSSGKLYYLNRVSVLEVDFTGNLAPQITTHPQSQTVIAGQPVTFTVVASGTAPLSYQWQRNSSPIPGATSASYTIPSTSTTDNGARFLCVVTNSFGSTPSNAATLTVITATGGLVGYWAFDENSGTTAADTSGNGRNGVVNAATWTAGKVNSALSFNGSTSSVITPGIPLSATFSISAWVNSAVSNQGGYSRIAETQYNGGMYLGMNGSGSAYQFIVNTGSGTTGSCGAAFGCAIGGSVSPGWHLVTGTYDGTTGRLYLDGALAASETFTAPANTNFPLTVGRYYGGSGFGWNGAIDEVRLYNKALSSAEVAQLFGPGGGQGLIGYWAFDEGSGTAAADTSGNGRNGVVNAATWTAGKVNSALSFNGSTSSVITPGIPLSATFSISAWVNSAVSNQGGYSRIAETQYNGGMYLGMNGSGSAYQFIVNTGSGTTGSCGAAFGCAIGGSVSPGWHLVTGTYDGTTGRLYLDGALAASETFTAPANTNFPLTVGRYYGGSGFGWNGAIDEVRLYNKALSSAEVAQLFGPGGGQGLIGYWAFDEGSGTAAADTSGNGRNGVVNAATWTAGKVNSALSFNGSTSSVITPGIPLSATFSISAWVNSAVSNQGGYSRIAETQYNGGMYLGMNGSGSAYQFIVNTGSGTTGSCGAAFGCAIGGSVSPGWHLVTGTYDGTTGRLYLDGALAASETFTAPANTNFPLTVGRYYGGSGFGWNGAIDEVRLYNKALSSAEVAQLFGPGGGQGLIGYWAFDEGSGTAADTSGNGCNGVVNAATRQRAGIPVVYQDMVV